MTWKRTQYFLLLSGMGAAAITPFYWLTFHEQDTADNLFKVIVATALSLVGTGSFVSAILTIRKHFHKGSEHRIKNFAAGAISFLMSFASVWIAIGVVWGGTSPEMVLFYILLLMAYWVCLLLMVAIYKPSALR